MTGISENTAEGHAAGALTVIKPVSLLGPFAWAMASALLFVIPGAVAVLCVAGLLPFTLEWIVIASMALFAIFVLVGLASGFIVPLTFGLMANVDPLAALLETRLEERLDSLLAGSALRAGALDLKVVKGLFETLPGDAGGGASERAGFLSLRGRAHAYLIAKAVSALRLQLLDELGAWHRDKGEESLTAETLQAFLLERLKGAVAAALESRLRALRRVAAGAWLAFLLAPFALLLAMEHSDLRFRVAANLADLTVERLAASLDILGSDSESPVDDVVVPACEKVPAPKAADAGRSGDGGRTKVHLNIATLGDPVSARELSAAVTKVLFARGFSAFYPTPCFEAGKADRRRGLALYIRHAEFETDSHHFANAVCATRQSCIAGLISSAMAPDIVVFAVSATRGLDRQSREQLRLLHALGTPRVVLFVDRPAGGEDPAALVAEIRGLLKSDAAGTPAIIASSQAALAGSAAASEIARFAELLEELDRTADPVRRIDRPFLMPIGDTWKVAGRGTVALGQVAQGEVRPGDHIEIVGLGPTRTAEVTAVEMFRKRLDKALAGDQVGIVFADLEQHEIERGQVLAAPGFIAPMRRFRALAYALEESDGGRDEGLKGPSGSQFHLRTTFVIGSFQATGTWGPIAPGRFGSIDVELMEPLALALGDRVALRDGGRTVAVAVVVGLEE